MAQYPYVCITGENSRVYCSATKDGRNMNINGSHAGFYALDGADVRLNGLNIGNTSESTNAFALIRSSSVDTWSNIDVGYTSCSNKLIIAGEKANVTTMYNSLLRLNGKGASQLVFEVPEDGYLDDNGAYRAPLRPGYLTIYDSTATDYGAPRLVVKVKDFCKKHPKTTIPLISTTNADTKQANFVATTNNLVTLAATAIVADTHRNVTFSVSDNGRTILMTVPQESGTMLIMR